MREEMRKKMREEISEKGSFIRWKSKRGSEMMEAAMVFPIVIITAMVMLVVMIGLYGEAESMAYTQVGLLAKSSTCEAHMIGSSPVRSPESYGFVSKKDGLLQDEYTGEFTADSVYRLPAGLGNDFNAARTHKVKVNILNEMGYIRCLDAGKWVLQGFS